MAWFFWTHSLRQDASADPAGSARVRRWSGPAMIVFAITVNFAAFDWLMSLDPHWFSTIFGVYFFSGSVVGFLAALTLLMAIAADSAASGRRSRRNTNTTSPSCCSASSCSGPTSPFRNTC